MTNLELVRFVYLAGSALIVVGIMILAMNMFFHRREIRRGEIGGIILIGPFPIVFGTSRRMMKIMLITAFAIVAIILLAFFLPNLTRGI